MNWVAIAVGGLSGVMVRAVLMSYLPVLQGVSITVFVVNVLGCALSGAVTGYGQSHQLPTWLVMGIGIGFLGGLTTFSGLILDAFVFLKNGSAWTALFYVTANVVVGFGMLLGSYNLTSP